jgi:ubiquitin-conjugating enzyme E2 T
MSNTPYEKGIFKLEIIVGERYPNEPPQITFITKVYHPNIDDKGRICLNILKNPPQGVYSPGNPKS